MREGTTIIPAMDRLSVETKLEILKLVFPDLRYGGDPGIERYFELRRERRLAQALAIYNKALRVRYPDDTTRVRLLKLYREADPGYAALQERLVLETASKLCDRIRSNLDLITAPLEKADLSDALRALKAVESVLARLPGETEAALALLERYDRFARILGHREALARRAFDLVREYDAVSRADSPADYDFVARSAAIEERRRSAGSRPGSRAASVEESQDFVSRSARLEERRKSTEKSKPSYFDPARIRFTQADKDRVEISSALKRREDKVIALCAKYWPYAKDPAFERIVFLYSRKFGGRHFEAYRAIKLGRARGSTDDEILSAVAAILTTSYSYSVSGDLYMQIMWRRLRARMEARSVAERLAAPGPEATTRAGPAPALESRVRTKRAQADAESPRAPLSVAHREAPQLPRTEGLGLRAASRVAAIPQRRVPAPPAPWAPTTATSPSAVASAAPKPTPNTTRPAADSPAAPLAPRAETPTAASAKAAAPELPRPLAMASSEAKRAAPKRGKAPHVAAVPGTAASGTVRSEKNKRPCSPGEAALLTPATAVKGRKLISLTRSGPQPLREIRARRGSISDSIRKLSGKTYDVYRELFLEKVRDHIHRCLLSSRTKSHGIFDTTVNDAEDYVFFFISAHYDDPFMDWERSAEREAVEALGFSMPSLDPIVEACFKKL